MGCIHSGRATPARMGTAGECQSTRHYIRTGRLTLKKNTKLSLPRTNAASSVYSKRLSIRNPTDRHDQRMDEGGVIILFL